MLIPHSLATSMTVVILPVCGDLAMIYLCIYWFINITIHLYSKKIAKSLHGKKTPFFRVQSPWFFFLVYVVNWMGISYMVYPMYTSLKHRGELTTVKLRRIPRDPGMRCFHLSPRSLRLFKGAKNASHRRFQTGSIWMKWDEMYHWRKLNNCYNCD